MEKAGREYLRQVPVMANESVAHSWDGPSEGHIRGWVASRLQGAEPLSPVQPRGALSAICV
jgi:hypothetical protein